MEGGNSVGERRVGIGVCVGGGGVQCGGGRARV